MLHRIVISMNGPIMKRVGDTGESGISPMILLIAMILISSTAAGLLIQFGGDLLARGGSTGEAVRRYASSQYSIESITVVDEDDDGRIDNFYITVGLAPGSEPLSLERSIVTITTADVTANLGYSNSTSGESSTKFNCEAPSTSSGGSGELGEIADPEGTFTADSPDLSPGCKVYIHVDYLQVAGGVDDTDEMTAGQGVDLHIQSDSSSKAYVQFHIPDPVTRQMMIIRK
ncbi:hypothetical protein B6U90_02090 [Thermoplasmatales archaeon ex4484_6]|nr:MAG: hypothetical protein B6U90_02090 [Thermoplasmatales archaeon ex4484_6]